LFCIRCALATKRWWRIKLGREKHLMLWCRPDLRRCMNDHVTGFSPFVVPPSFSHCRHWRMLSSFSSFSLWLLHLDPFQSMHHFAMRSCSLSFFACCSASYQIWYLVLQSKKTGERVRRVERASACASISLSVHLFLASPLYSILLLEVLENDAFSV